MPFLPASASFPQPPRGPGGVRAGTPAVAATPAWARPQVSWPFVAVVPLAKRSTPAAPASFTV